MARRDEYTDVASSVPFDNDTNGFIADDVQGAIEEISNTVAVSASPGFTFGKGGTVTANSWLLCDGSVPSNTAGRAIYLYNPYLTAVFIRCEQSTTCDFEVYEHDGTTYTLKYTANLVAARSLDIILSPEVSLTKGKELAIKVVTGSVKNPVVGCQLKGSTTP